MSQVKKGFDYAVNDAHRCAKAGFIDGVMRHLAAAHALALWADTTLLEEYGRHESSCWKEYEAWKTTTAG